VTHCPNCGNEYQRIGTHFGAKSTPCDYPDLTERQSEIITGLLMGDGSITGTSSSSGSNPYLQTQMVSKEFLDWVDDELGIYSNGCSLQNTAKEQADRNNSDGEYQDVYGLNTMRAPVFEQWASWYDTGEKRFPEINLTPTIAGVWYVCDGWKNKQISGGRPIACIGAANEYERRERIVKSFEENGFNGSWIRRSIRLTADSSEEFWEWAEQPPGFEYKWPNNA